MDEEEHLAGGAVQHGKRKRGCRRLRGDGGKLARAQLWAVVRSGSAASTVAAQLPSSFSAVGERRRCLAVVLASSRQPDRFGNGSRTGRRRCS
jgi:hypothetical protein